MIRKKSSSGFTIVELLIVIVVIAILASITVVSYTGIQARATETSMRSDLSANYKIIQLYSAKNGGVYPPGTIDPVARNNCTPKGDIGTDGYYCPILSDKNATVVYRGGSGNSYTLIYGKGTQAYSIDHNGTYKKQACVAGESSGSIAQPFGYDFVYSCPDGISYSQ